MTYRVRRCPVSLKASLVLSTDNTVESIHSSRRAAGTRCIELNARTACANLISQGKGSGIYQVHCGGLIGYVVRVNASFWEAHSGVECDRTTLIELRSRRRDAVDVLRRWAAKVAP